LDVTAETVLALLDLLKSAEIEAWLDGGWGVDALLGYQSRHHDDLDVVVALDHVARLQEVLVPRGFEVSEDHLPVRFVMAHPDLGHIDFHTVTFDPGGGGVQVQPNGGTFRYPPEGFTFGMVLSERVSCISAEVQMLCHRGYEPDEKSGHDVLLLHQQFGLDLPPEYERFQKRLRG
jgi:lincosamide nucleotidyltransferase A/C/D/E